MCVCVCVCVKKRGGGGGKCYWIALCSIVLYLQLKVFEKVFSYDLFLKQIQKKTEQSVRYMSGHVRYMSDFSSSLFFLFL